MRLVILEDELAVSLALRYQLESQLPDCHVEVLRSEGEFRHRFEDFAESPPDVFILDAHVPYGPEKNAPDVGSTMEAGLRCQRMITTDKRTCGVPVIILSIFGFRELQAERGSFPKNVYFRTKPWNSHELVTLVRTIAIRNEEPNRDIPEVFVVHGRDMGFKAMVARFLEHMGLRPIILDEQASKGRAILQKFVDHSDVCAAVVILTGDDKGGLKGTKVREQRTRPRQNVVFELGFYIAKLGSERVVALYEEGVELPSDYAGIAYVPIDDRGGWQIAMVRELRAAGLPIAPGVEYGKNP